MNFLCPKPFFSFRSRCPQWGHVSVPDKSTTASHVSRFLSLSPPKLRAIEGDAAVMLATPTPTRLLSSASKTLIFRLLNPPSAAAMSISLSSHAFAGNPIRSRTPKPTSQFSINSALETLKSRILERVPGNPLARSPDPDFKVLPFRKGRPLATSGEDEDAGPRWRLRWVGLDECARLSGELGDDRFVYLGWRDDGGDGGVGVVYWAIDVSEGGEGFGVGDGKGEEGWCFVELRTLMVATDWEDQGAMGELAIAGHVSVSCSRTGPWVVVSAVGDDARGRLTAMHFLMEK